MAHYVPQSPNSRNPTSQHSLKQKSPGKAQPLPKRRLKVRQPRNGSQDMPPAQPMKYIRNKSSFEVFDYNNKGPNIPLATTPDFNSITHEKSQQLHTEES